MTTDTLPATVLDEAEAIVRAEWMRLQHNSASRKRKLAGACAALPAARGRRPQVALLTAASPRPDARPPEGSKQWSPRRRPGQVWPPSGLLRSTTVRGPIAFVETEVMP